MTVGIWVLGDQLWQDQSALASEANAPIILIESHGHSTKRRYHRQKLVLVWSAMRHFAAELEATGRAVTYEIADDFVTPLRQWVEQNQITELRVMEPADRPFARFLNGLDLSCQLTIVPNNHFLWSVAEFKQWADGRKSLLMESFYREGRKRYGMLMEGTGKKRTPVGGQWNYDKENRKPPKKGINPPVPQWFKPDKITRQVMQEVAKLDTFGDLEPFGWAVTRAQALQVLDYFITVRLNTFGPYQDAMVTGEDTLWHGLLSPYLNLGLLHPLEVIQAVEAAYKQQDQPLNSVEGFIRQVLGWREYMRGLYSYVDEDYPQGNYFEHHQPLPEFFWTGDTPMNCLHQSIDQVKRTGYNHHIQRLMILSNFALIAGLSPQAVESWFHAAFIDAYDWVMQTNVIGMGLFADGGVLATKPYAASANYINRMSDYCKDCQYHPKLRTGENACPFNFFYWDFLARHRDILQNQGRMNFILKNLDKMSAEEYAEIRENASQWHEQQTP
ncbi:deoxyribodipyrimidine photolyase-related protein [Leptolyngbya sp. Heron Island J]|uniref:cryptochrome/photolyase family protein n=1 Tax=Leptolyngbya sp. Heron Island J TaxID=1385935 RepID=UPI0003B9F368|nr:cryptochrome/photolyase family protein [Leptolyngbya sp. Heron Island J]ESA33866.1 deoxyribodipyrimidine photolyase-related protein [Leptolyngbya sp. Heron Island J]